MTRILGGKEIKLNISELVLEERVDSEVFGFTTLYFIGPKELINDKYPEAESTEISVEFDTDNPYGPYLDIMISPTKDGEDYDWSYLYIDDSGIVSKLIEIGLSEEKESGDEQNKQDRLLPLYC